MKAWFIEVPGGMQRDEMGMWLSGREWMAIHQAVQLPAPCSHPSTPRYNGYPKNTPFPPTIFIYPPNTLHMLSHPRQHTQAPHSFSPAAPAPRVPAAARLGWWPSRCGHPPGRQLLAGGAPGARARHRGRNQWTAPRDQQIWGVCGRGGDWGAWVVWVRVVCRGKEGDWGRPQANGRAGSSAGWGGVRWHARA